MARTYVLRYVRCGNARCQRCKRGDEHGPYWYAFWSEFGRTRCEYIGKDLPPHARPSFASRKLIAALEHDARTARALRALGLRKMPDRDELRRAYKAAALKHHPDRGGDHTRMVAINAAKDHLERLV